LLDKYFPTTSWRCIGGKHYAHVETLRLVYKMFEYGLWTSEDLTQLLSVMQSKVEILQRLDKLCVNDISKLSSCREQMFFDFQNCKYYATSILLHTMFMINDGAYFKSLEHS
jgi:hypothetical protein